MPIRDVTCSILGSPEPYQSHLECSRPIDSTKFLIMIKKFVFQKPLQTCGKVTYPYICIKLKLLELLQFSTSAQYLNNNNNNNNNNNKTFLNPKP